MYLAAMMLGGILGGVIAWNKGRSIFVWTVACGVLPLLLIVLLVLPRMPRVGVWRPCPFCLRIIPWQARACSYCGREVPQAHMMSCKYCNHSVWAGEQVCGKCGKPAPWEETSSTPAKDAPAPPAL